LEEYRTARRLLAINVSLLNAKGRQMRDTYVQLAEGKFGPVELVTRLDAVCSEGDRENVLRELEGAQAAAERQEQSRVADLLARAQRLDSTAEGLEALGLLREILAVDPSNDEAFDLMEKISAYYKGKTTTNSIDMELVWIPAGEFVMGKEGDVRQPRHTVKITGAFWMSVREVTCGQYQAITRKNTRAPDDDAAPARNVSWYDARTFCRRLSEKEGRNYRLPTEAEWEYACRAGASTDYWWGDDPEADPCTPNPFGLLHMNDGVAEWCQDVVSVGYYIASPNLDPQGPSEEYRKERIFRGGHSLARLAGKGTCYYRDGESPKAEYDNLGFRVVLESSFALDQASLVSTQEPADCQGL
jgi:formylglycine-generating enzyme required for sulfatase activity